MLSFIERAKTLMAQILTSKPIGACEGYAGPSKILLSETIRRLESSDIASGSDVKLTLESSPQQEAESREKMVTLHIKEEGVRSLPFIERVSPEVLLTGVCIRELYVVIETYCCCRGVRATTKPLDLPGKARILSPILKNFAVTCSGAESLM